MQTTTDWARENGEHFTYSAAADNYTPCPRDYLSGVGHRYSMPDGREGIVLEDASHFKVARVIFLVDDGRTVEPYFVGGWRDDADYIVIHRFPTNFNADGSPLMRGDRDEQVDFGTWMLGPRTAYHLKVKFSA